MMTEQELLRFNKPYAYFGNELNSIHKDHTGKIRVALVYPDLYEIGMSSLGFKILYHFVNEFEDVVLERFFAPQSDFEEYLRNKKIPLFSLESRTPLKDFDLIGFSVQTTLDFSNVLNIIDLAQIEILAEKRDKSILFMGGTCAYNPEPMSKFFDFFALGEGEVLFPEILQTFRNWDKKSKKEFLMQIAGKEGFYVPSSVEHEVSGTLEVAASEKTFTKRIVTDFEDVYFPTKPVVPFGSVAMDKACVEIFRGCTRGCRFCEAGMIYRPVREKSISKIRTQLLEILKNTGYEEVTFLSLSTGDYSDIEGLENLALELIEKYHVSVSLPSLRIDMFPDRLAEIGIRQRTHSITFALEAATERMRRVINKTIRDEDIFATVEKAARAGFHTFKFYLMIGLPGETEEDIKGIVRLTNEIYKCATLSKSSAKTISIHLSINPFMPQPHTPFQWEAFENLDSLRAKKEYILKSLRGRQYKVDFGNFEMNYIETVLARGDRRIGDAIHSYFKKGGKMDAWHEFFDFKKWLEAFDECAVNHENYAGAISLEQKLPWQHINSGVSIEFLKREYRRSKKMLFTQDCRRSECLGCGVSKDFECATQRANKAS